MALGEKKELLRQMHERTDAERAVLQAQPSADAARLENRFETPVRLLVLGLVVAFVIIGTLAVGHFCYQHYSAGLAFETTGVSRITAYVKDSVKLMAIIVLSGLLGGIATLVFRETLSRRLVWCAVIGLALLLPIGIAAIPGMVMSYNKGLNEAYAKLDAAALQIESLAVQTKFKLPDDTPRYVMPGDPEWSWLPQHVRDTLKPQAVYFFDGGTLYLMGGSYPEEVEGIFVPNYPQRVNEARSFASAHGFSLLQNDPPVYRVQGFLSEEAFTRPGSPASTMPGHFISPEPWGAPTTTMPAP